MPDTADIAAKLGQLGVTVGIIDANIQANPEQYAPAVEGWESWKEGVIDLADEKIQEAIGFAEFYDDDGSEV